VKRTEPRVAIDGPAGAGKSTVSRRVAEALGYVLLDTGALYRSIALAAHEAGIPWSESTRVGELAAELAARHAIRFDGAPGGAPPRLLLDGRDVSTAIRTQEISDGASQVSSIPAVRDALMELQRSAAAGGGVVLEGRDIGTVVLPDAEAKFYLTASVAVRATRRYDELVARGQRPTREEVEEEVRERDRRDTMRPIAPLRQAVDAELVDSTGRTVDEVVAFIVARVRAAREKLAAETSR
jgi:CMP/dCMP kinase